MCHQPLLTSKPRSDIKAIKGWLLQPVPQFPLLYNRNESLLISRIMAMISKSNNGQI